MFAPLKRSTLFFVSATLALFLTACGAPAPTGDDPGTGQSANANENGDGGGEDPSPAGETLTLDLGDGVNMELVRIPAGSFMMGSENGYNDETPVHSVTITHDFYIGRYEVTQAQWQAVMGTSPWTAQQYVLEQADRPATYVNWDDSVQFCQTLSASTGYDIRLPSEAEWEYAARAGTTTEYSFGDDWDSLGDYAWYEANGSSVGQLYAHPVGQKLPNPWGFYDMHGNASEWCNDWFSSSYYSDPESVQPNPDGPSSATSHVFRGGAWWHVDIDCRSAVRIWSGTGSSSSGSVGFRVASGT